VVDEVWYRGYRDVPIVEPVHIVGLPRSGTSLLHATLADDEARFTTLRLWHVLFAPSVVQRRMIARLARFDRALGRPARRAASRIESKLSARMNGAHPINFGEPAEDFLLLLPAVACFLLVVAFPRSQSIWALTRIDEWNESERRSLLLFYRSCLQRHLYASGSRVRVLSKNPSFTACIGTLREVFPDARFLFCARDPANAIPSQLSSLRPGLQKFGYDPADPAIREPFIEMYECFINHATDLLGPMKTERAGFVSLDRLSADLAGTVQRLYGGFGWTPDAAFSAALTDRSRYAASYRTRHHYRLDDFGLDPDRLRQRLGPALRRLDVLARRHDRRTEPTRAASTRRARSRTPRTSSTGGSDGDAEFGHLRIAVFSDAIPGRNGVGTFYDDLADALTGHVAAIGIVAPPLHPAVGERGWSVAMPGDATQRIHIPWVPEIWNRMRWTCPHVILAATPSLYGVTGLLMARRLGVGAALCYHTEFPKLAGAYWTGLRAATLPGLLDLWDRILVRWSPAVLAPNRELARALASKGRVDARVMATLAPRRFVDHEAAAPPDAVNSVAFVGRLAPEKSIEAIIEAAHALPDITFRIVGDGPMRAAVDAAVATLANVEYTPWTGRDGVMKILDATDLIVLPSRHETFGTAAFEAMIRGRLALVSLACGITGWSELRAGLFIMHRGESVTEAITRIRALGPKRLSATACIARRISHDVHRAAVREWLETLSALARATKG